MIKISVHIAQAAIFGGIVGSILDGVIGGAIGAALGLTAGALTEAERALARHQRST